MVNQIFYNGPSFARLHEYYAKQGRLDERAPVKAAAHIDIHAPVEQVWQQLVALPDWPTIDASFRNVQLASTVRVDASFTFVLNRFPIKAKFAVVAPNRQLTWTGVTFWFKAVDVHLLQPTADGGARLSINESLAGVLAPLFISSAQLQKQHERWLFAFKQVIEARNKGYPPNSSPALVTHRERRPL